MCVLYHLDDEIFQGTCSTIKLWCEIAPQQIMIVGFKLQNNLCVWSFVNLGCLFMKTEINYDLKQRK